jgi:amidophosphoribosyltransferase
LAYISIDGMTEATTIAKPRLCRACFDGEYPMDLPDLAVPEAEQDAMPDVDGVGTLTAGIGGADALRRP